jgi:hypothetical protein
VRDTQVGLKLFRREVLIAVLPRIVVKRYAFDLELLVVTHHLGFSRVVEAPVHIGQRFSSTINRQAIANILLETAATFYRKNVLRYYDTYPTPGTAHALPTLTDAELSAADEQRMAYNVVGWLAGGCSRMMRSCYTGGRVWLGHDSTVKEAIAEYKKASRVAVPNDGVIRPRL